MVTHMSWRNLAVLSVLPCLVSVAGCGSVSEPPNSGTDPSSQGPAETPHPHPPTVCEGIRDQTAVETLVGDGDAVALVSVTINQQPGKEYLFQRDVPIDTSQLLSGNLPAGPVETVQESAANDTVNALPPGAYLLLLGDGGEDSTYFLSDGLRGSFVIDGDQAYQQCPNYAQPDKPFTIHEGVTQISELAAMFSKALDR